MRRSQAAVIRPPRVGPARAGGRLSGVKPPEAQVLRLQRLAGNAAVLGLLGGRPHRAPGRSRPARLQRTPEGTGDHGPPGELRSPVLAGDDHLSAVLHRSAGGPLLKPGSSQAVAVKRLQKGLLVCDPEADLGATGVGGVDGDFGPRTAAAVRAFQSGHGLADDAVVGPVTLAALDAHLEGAWSPGREAVAIGLADAGPRPGATLVVPPGTEASLAAFGRSGRAPAHPPVRFDLLDGPAGMELRHWPPGSPRATLVAPAPVVPGASTFTVAATWATVASPPTVGGEVRQGAVGGRPGGRAGDVVVILDDTTDAQGRALAGSSTAKVVRADSLDALRAGLARVKGPVRNLVFVGHGTNRGALMVGTSWVPLADVADALSGLSGLKPATVDVAACNVGQSSSSLELLRAAVGAGSARGANCFRKVDYFGPVELDGKKIVRRSQLRADERDTFGAVLREQLDDQHGDKARCAPGFRDSDDRLAQEYFARAGVLPIVWFGPTAELDYNVEEPCAVDVATRSPDDAGGDACALIEVRPPP